MPFAKGKSGNPGGRPKGYADVEALARQHAPEAISALVEALNDPKSKVAAASALLDRGFGRPTQRVDANINLLDKLAPDELTSLAASLAHLTGEPEDAAERSATTH